MLLTLLLWIAGVIHAVLVVNNYTHKRTGRIEKAIPETGRQV